VIGGRVRRSAAAIAEHLAAGGDLASADLPGVSRRRIGIPRPAPKSAFPAPRRDGLPVLALLRRAEEDGTIVAAGYVEATRGCHHTPAPTARSPRSTAGGSSSSRATGYWTTSPGRWSWARGTSPSATPTSSTVPRPLAAILRVMRDAGLRSPSTPPSRSEHQLEHRQRLPELAALGCRFVVSAVESLNEEALRRMK